MRIDEVEIKDQGADPKTLLGLVNFLAGRAEDTNSKKQIDKGAFIQAARSLGIALTPDTLDGVLSQPPLNNVVQPSTPDNPNVIYFKDAQVPSTKMTVSQAQQVVNKNAKSAMNRIDRPV
jgi:hypothetical protein